jgi:hypothetical protein
VAERSKARTVFANSSARIVGLNPTRSIDVRVLFSVLFCAQVEALGRACPPIQVVLPTVYRIKNLKERSRPNKRAVEPLIITKDLTGCDIGTLVSLFQACGCSR